MKIFTLAIALLFCQSKTEAQVINLQNFHLTVFAGVANYNGDLQDKWFTFSQSRFAVGMGGLTIFQIILV